MKNITNENSDNGENPISESSLVFPTSDDDDDGIPQDEEDEAEPLEKRVKHSKKSIDDEEIIPTMCMYTQ